MTKIFAIEPAIDPTARPTFLLDWELTLKCNLDCSYCPTEGPWRSHDNTEPHPPLDECLATIDFMYKYVDLYMARKPSWSRAVILNIYGGESLYHPNIVEILEQVKEKHKPYQDSWPLTITCTTNAVVSTKQMSRIADLIDEFTVSYHCENLPKQKQQFLNNLLLLKEKNKRVKCIVLMHGKYSYWPELEEIISFCQEHNVKYLPRQLDGDINSNYNEQQIIWFKNLWEKRSPQKSKSQQSDIVDGKINQSQLSKVGRACCGGRLMCANTNLKQPVFYIPDNHFEGWSCSVNWFFLSVRQSTGEIFVNKDCRMNFDGTVSPLGMLSDTNTLILNTKQQLETGIPYMTCARERCYCGLCAPKAETPDQLLDIMKKHVVSNRQS
jgi:pyruvate-formate lyase-activating enzyme